nr:MAG TPA: hypothetical protein [Caudoviricetes sp.]
MSCAAGGMMYRRKPRLKIAPLMLLHTAQNVSRTKPESLYRSTGRIGSRVPNSKAHLLLPQMVRGT